MQYPTKRHSRNGLNKIFNRRTAEEHRFRQCLRFHQRCSHCFGIFSWRISGVVGISNIIGFPFSFPFCFSLTLTLSTALFLVWNFNIGNRSNHINQRWRCSQREVRSFRGRKSIFGGAVRLTRLCRSVSKRLKKLWVFPKIGVPKIDVFWGETLLDWMIWWYPYFWKHPYQSLGKHLKEKTIW